jgi:hypothetical protein
MGVLGLTREPEVIYHEAQLEALADETLSVLEVVLGAMELLEDKLGRGNDPPMQQHGSEVGVHPWFRLQLCRLLCLCSLFASKMEMEVIYKAGRWRDLSIVATLVISELIFHLFRFCLFFRTKLHVLGEAQVC